MTLVVRPTATLNGVDLRQMEVHASTATAWRTARLKSDRLPGDFLVMAGYAHGKTSPVFQAALADDVAGDWRGQSENALVRGLPEWRRELNPQGFQDVRLEALLNWIAQACGGKLALNVQGKPFRHYQIRKGPAHVAVREALVAWRMDATLMELDGGTLHVGPAEQSPHARAGVQAVLVAGRNIYQFSDVGDGRLRLEIPGMSWLRVGHQVEVRHPVKSGTGRINEITHVWTNNARTRLGVTL